jgi:GPH family glycoside/pentoside/hexuronide:cation symporter
MPAGKLSNSEVNKYAFYGLTNFIATTVTGSYLNIFITDNLLISAALMGTILTSSRIIDFFISAISGGIIEKVKLKWGKYRSWVLISKYVSLISLSVLFLNTGSLPLEAKCAIIIIAYLGLNLSMNFVGTATFGIMALMAGPSMEDRSRLSIRQTQLMAVGQILISASAIPFLNLMSPAVGQTNAYTVLAVLAALILFYGMQVMGKVAKPYDVPAASGGGPEALSVTVKDMVKAVLTNDQMLKYMVADFCMKTGSFGISGIAAYYFIYILGNFNYMAIAMTIITGFSFFASLVCPGIGIRLGKKRAMVIGLLVSTLSSAGIALFGHLGLPVYIGISFITMLGNYLYVGFGVNYILDCGEYDLWKTGKDNRTVLMSLFNLPMKLGFLVGGAVGAFGLALIGYQSGMDPLAVPGFVRNFMLILGGVPALLYALGALIFGVGYKITDADAARYARENAERAEAVAV